MKRSFLFTLILASLVAIPALAQTPKTTILAKTEEKGSFDKFYERLKIAYFAAYSGSSINNWDGRALDEHGAKDKSYAHNLFNQVSFNYNFGAKMNFILNPRFTINTGGTAGHAREGNGLLIVEDMMAGFQGVIITSDDKKFNWWMRAALRLPTSRASRRQNITYQPDLANSMTYDFNTTWQLGAMWSLRQWVFEQRYTDYRYRVYVAPFVQYTITDTFRLQMWWQTYAENRNRAVSQNGKKHKFEEEYQDVMMGFSKDITPKFNIFPFIGYQLNTTYGGDKPLDAAYLGAWISYQIK